MFLKWRHGIGCGVKVLRHIYLSGLHASAHTIAGRHAGIAAHTAIRSAAPPQAAGHCRVNAMDFPVDRHDHVKLFINWEGL
jgi:hypothetical protein